MGYLWGVLPLFLVNFVAILLGCLWVILWTDRGSTMFLLGVIILPFKCWLGTYLSLSGDPSMCAIIVTNQWQPCSFNDVKNDMNIAGWRLGKSDQHKNSIAL